MSTFYHHEACSATYIADKKRINFTFNGYPVVDAIQEMFLNTIDFMKENQTVAFYNDLRNAKGTFTNLIDWLVNDMKVAIELGLKYDAVVLNDDVFSVFSANNLSTKVTKIEIQMFKDPVEAEKWLDSKEQ